MRTLWAAILGLASAGSAFAQECPFERAIYAQSTGWVLRFEPTDTYASANQTARFYLDLRAGETLKGAVYWPNGYSTPIYTLDGPCELGSVEEACNFMEGEHHTVYVLGQSGIERMPEDMSGPAPEQVVFPAMGSALWYSSYRESEFSPDQDPGEVFALSGCTPQ